LDPNDPARAFAVRRDVLGFRRRSSGTRSGAEKRAEGRALRSLLIIVYFVIGVVVAASHHYFTHLNSVKPIASAALAIVLWPLVMFGVSLHLK
jgi:hypothetical protein